MALTWGSGIAARNEAPSEAKLRGEATEDYNQSQEAMKDRVTAVVLGLLAVALLLALKAPRPHVESPRERAEVPNFRFEWAGRSAELGDLRGQVVLLNFWATWCPPCVAEMPSLERLHHALKDKGLFVLGISVDADPRAYETFLRQHGITFPNFRDPERRISTLYGTFMYPETYIIDPQGLLVRKIIGPLGWDDPQVVEFLNRLLQGAATSSD
jgi:thiol-disulfide isomerase/thioredoxin